MKRFLQAVCVTLALVLLGGCMRHEKPVPQPLPPARVAVVLGAGASRGFAHIGVLKILEAHRVPVHMVVGTSVGSFVGSLYAFGFSAFQLQELSFGIERSDIVDWVVPDNGFVKGEKLEAYVNHLVRNTPIERMRIPFYAVATDLRNGTGVAFASGNTGTAVRASCSIPGIFRPVRIGDGIFVDGGLVSPVAVDFARKHGADLIIAVDISAAVESAAPLSTAETIMQSALILYSSIAQGQLRQADVVIRPRVGHIGSTDFTKRHEAILEGERAALEAMPQIRDRIERLQTEGRL